jgi:hypothetical protein
MAPVHAATNLPPTGKKWPWVNYGHETVNLFGITKLNALVEITAP